MRVRNVRGQARTVHAYVAETEPAMGAAEIGVVFLDTRGRVLKTMRQAPPQSATRDLAVFRGILLAFWAARRLGARAVIVHSDNPAVVRQITGELEVAPALTGPYLQVRALLHAYRAARVQIDDLGRGRAVLAAVAAARGGKPDADGILDALLLWKLAGRQPELVT